MVDSVLCLEGPCPSHRVDHVQLLEWEVRVRPYFLKRAGILRVPVLILLAMGFGESRRHHLLSSVVGLLPLQSRILGWFQ